MTEAASNLSQPLKLIRGLNALGYYVHPELVCQGRYSLYDLGLLTHRVYEGAVNLQDIHRVAMQKPQGGVACAEVIQEYPDAQI